jgi:hypothetical protein
MLAPIFFDSFQCSLRNFYFSLTKILIVCCLREKSVWIIVSLSEKFFATIDDSGVARWFLFRPKIPIWVNLGGPRLEIVEIFQGHLEYFTDIWDISWPSGTFCVHLVLFPGFGIMYQEQSGNPVDEERKKILSRKSFFCLSSRSATRLG